MRAPEPMPGVRLAGAPASLDALTWPPGTTVVRIAPDEAFALGAEAPQDASVLAEPEAGFVGWWLTAEEAASVRHHLDWPAQPGLHQGLLAGVPVKLLIGPDRSLLLVARAYAHELEARL